MWGWTIMLSACAIVITVADNLVRIPIFLVAAGVTVYAIVKLRLLGDALRHHFNPRTKPNRSKTKEGSEESSVVENSAVSVEETENSQS